MIALFHNGFVTASKRYKTPTFKTGKSFIRRAVRTEMGASLWLEKFLSIWRKSTCSRAVVSCWKLESCLQQARIDELCAKKMKAKDEPFDTLVCQILRFKFVICSAHSRNKGCRDSERHRDQTKTVTETWQRDMGLWLLQTLRNSSSMCYRKDVQSDTYEPTSWRWMATLRLGKCCDNSTTWVHELQSDAAERYIKDSSLCIAYSRELFTVGLIYRG